MGTISRRERKKQETHQRLLECAWQLFQDQGYDCTTVEDITESADVAKGTFFNYFSTKEALVEELAMWRIDQVGQYLFQSEDAPKNSVTRIKMLIGMMTSRLSPEYELIHRLLLARISAPVKQQGAHRLGSIVHELVEQGQANDEIRNDMEAGLVARLLMTTLFYQFMRFHHSSDNSDLDVSAFESKAIETVDQLFEGLKGPAWRVE